MKIAIIICRSLLGLAFIVFGANILHPFMPMPTPPPESLQAQFMGVMVPTGWMTFVGVMQLLGGLLVIAGRTAPLGLTILGPILVNILCYHIFIDGAQGMAPGLVFSALEIFVIYGYWNSFKAIVTASAKPRS